MSERIKVICNDCDCKCRLSFRAEEEKKVHEGACPLLMKMNVWWRTK